MKKARFFIALASSLLFIRGALAAPEYISNFSSFPAYPYNTAAYKQGGAFVGCGPTTGAMMFGYFQRVNGLTDLLTNPVTGVNEGLNTAWALHGQAYMKTKSDGFGDFLNIEPGLEDYAESKGYTLKVQIHTAPYWTEQNPGSVAAYGAYGDAWINDGTFWSAQADGSWKFDRAAFCDFVAPRLAAGVPIFLTTDSDANGSGDHWVPLVGYDRATGQYAFYDTYTTTVHWADIYYAYDSAGKKINSITMVRTVELFLPDIASNPSAGTYGSVNVGVYSENTFVISNEGTADLNVTSTTVTGMNASEFIITSGGGAFTLAAGSTRDIVVRFTPAGPGSKSALLGISSNDRDENPFLISLSGTATASAPDIASNVASYSWGSLNVGTFREFTVVIKNEGGSDLNVSAMTITGKNASEFNITRGGGAFTLAPGAWHHLTVSFAPASTGDKTAGLRVSSNDPDENPFLVGLSGTATASAPDIASNVASYSWGSLNVGTSREFTVVIKNEGGSDLNVSAMTLSGANASEFIITSGGGAFTLAPGAWHHLAVSFAPASTGDKTADLSISCNDPDENPFKISLSGIGGSAPDILTIAIDGQKDSWYDQLTGPDEGYIHIPSFMHNENGAPDNDKDLSADLWVAWDATYLYVYEEVKDNVVHLNNPTNYQNDCLEMYFDPNPSLKKITGPPGFRLSALDSADVADPANLSGVADMKIYASCAATKADYSRRLTADGYVLECRVKWDWIQMPGWGPPVPAVGNSFGMAVMNHDNDVSRREGSIEWAAALKDAVFNDAQLHGTVTFEADHRLKLEAKNAIVPTNVNADAWAYVPGADLFRIAIDGQKDAWYNELTGPDEGYIHIPGFLHNDNGAPDNDKDLSANLWVAWDATYLYVYEEVKDNVVHLNNPTAWQNDCLEMYFDPDPSLKKITGPTGFGLSALDSADVEDPANLSGVADMSAFRSYAVTKADYGRRLTEDGYALECRVKWDWIQWPGWGPPVPAVGNIFGMAVMNHDNDVSQRKGSISWAAVLKDAVWNDTQLHGTVTFEADHRLKLEAKNAIVPTNVNADAWAYVPGADLFRIAIDAEKDAWYNELTGPDEGRVHIPFFMHNDDGAPDNNADLSADLWLAWDPAYLYFYEEVVDDVVHLNNATSWQDDCLEIYLDPDPSKAKTIGQLGFHMTALDSADTDPAYFAGVTSLTGYNCNLGSTKADYARKKTANGYILEGRVKWDAIKFADGSWGPLVPAIGKAFGMSTMNHDNDVSARDASISWAAVLKDAVWNDPRLHGTVTFEADHRLKLEAKNAIVPTNINADAWAYVPGTDLFRIAIDGHKDPFYETLTGPDDGYLQIRYFANSNIGLPKGGDPDLSAKVWSAWDNEWYYIYAEVMDDSVSAATVSNDWETDAMELKIDGQATDSTQTSVSNGTIITALDSTEVAKGLITNSLNGIAETDKQYARRKFDGGYVLEYAIKLSILGGNEPIDVGVGKVFGMAYHFIDNDGKGRDACIQWSAFLNDMIWNTPKYHATVKFLADNKLQFIPSNNMTGLTNPVPYDGSDDPSRMAVEDKTGIMKEFALSHNYPNPFNPTTTISYSIPSVSTIRLTVYDIMGRQVAVLVDEKQAPGIYKVNFDGRQMASGIYFYKLEAGLRVFKQKMVMLK